MKEILDIIITTHNDSQFLNEAIESVISDKSIQDEIGKVIIVDDGSETVHLKQVQSLIESHNKTTPNLMLLCNETPCGLSHARNVGIRESTAKYITFLDADDLKPPTWQKYVLKYLKNESPDILVTRSRLIDDFYNYLPFYDDNTAKSLFSGSNHKIFSGINKYNILLLEPQVGNKYFLAEHLKKKLFPIGRKYEDIYILSRMLLEMNEILFLNCTTHLYNITDRKDRITSSSALKFDILANLNNSIEIYKKNLYLNEKIKSKHEQEYSFNCLLYGYMRMIDWSLRTIDQKEIKDYATRASIILSTIPFKINFSRFLSGFIQIDVLKRYDQLLDILTNNDLEEKLNQYINIY